LSGRISESVPVRQLADTELRCDPEVSGRSWRATEPCPAICTVLWRRSLIFVF